MKKGTTKKGTREELGCPGHFICARDCNFRRHTQTAHYKISTVGDLYYSSDGDKAKRRTIGAGDDQFFETLVFELTDKQREGNEGCGCREVADWCEIDGRRWTTAGEAQAGHEAFVKKYINKKPRHKTHAAGCAGGVLPDQCGCNKREEK